MMHNELIPCGPLCNTDLSHATAGPRSMGEEVSLAVWLKLYFKCIRGLQKSSTTDLQATGLASASCTLSGVHLKQWLEKVFPEPSSRSASSISLVIFSAHSTERSIASSGKQSYGHCTGVLLFKLIDPCRSK